MVQGSLNPNMIFLDEWKTLYKEKIEIMPIKSEKISQKKRKKTFFSSCPKDHLTQKLSS